MPRDPRDERFLERAVACGVLDRDVARRLLEARAASPAAEPIETFLVRARVLSPAAIVRVVGFARATGLPPMPAPTSPPPPSPSPASPPPIEQRVTRMTPVIREVPSDDHPETNGPPPAPQSRAVSPEPWALVSPEPTPPRAQIPATDARSAPGSVLSSIPGTTSGLTKLRVGSSTPELAKRFGAYEILSEIARGGMGVVYRARKDGESQVVALKVLLEGTDATDNQVRRFEREIRAGLTLDHHGIVKVFDGGRAEGRLFFTMELIEGDSFDKLLGKLPLKEKVSIIEKVAHAVHAAHEKGIIHRDLKPQNVLIGADREPKVADFGLAKSIDPQSRLTKTGSLVGTPYYMSPEQARGELERIDRRSDVYALGAVLYQAITDALPFQADSALGLLGKIVNEDPKNPRELAPDCPPPLAAIALKALEKEQENRYQTALELAADLAAWQEGGRVSAIGPGARSMIARGLRRRRRALVGLAALGLSAIPVSIALVAVLRSKRTRHEAAQRKDLDDRTREMEAAVRASEPLLADAKLGHSIDLRDKLRRALSDLEKLAHAPEETTFEANRAPLGAAVAAKGVIERREEISAAYLTVAVVEARDADLAALVPRLASTLKAHPQREDLRLALALARERLGSPEEACALVQEAANENASPALLERLGDLDLELTDAPGAVEVFERALKLEPDRLHAKAGLVRALRAIDPERAFTLAHELEDRRDPSSRALVAETMLVHDPGAAIDVLHGIAHEFPNDPELARQVGELLLEAERPEEALVAFQRASEMAPRDPRPFAGIGEASLLDGDVVGAEKAFTRAAELAPSGDPRRAHARAREAWTRWLANEPSAPKVARDALDERPGDGSLQLLVLLLDSKREGAAEELGKVAAALGRRKDASTAWAALARLRAAARDALALEAAQQACKLAPDSADALAALVAAQEASGSPDIEETRTRAHKAFARDRDDAARFLRRSNIRWKLAVRFEGSGDAQSAVADDQAKATVLLDWAERAAPWAAAPEIERARRARRKYFRVDKDGSKGDIPPREVCDALVPALKIAGRDASAEAFLAFTWMETEEGMYQDQCEAVATRALELAQKEGDKEAQALALAGRGDARRVRGHAEEGLADLEASLALDKHRARVWLWKAKALDALGRPDQAAEAVKESDERGSSRDRVVGALRGEAMGIVGRSNQLVSTSFPAFQRAIDLDPTNGYMIYQYGVQLLGAGSDMADDPFEFISRGIYWNPTLITGMGDQAAGFIGPIDLATEAERYEAKAVTEGWDALWTSAVLRSLGLEEQNQNTSRERVAKAHLALERVLTKDPTAVSALAFRTLCWALDRDSNLARADAARVLHYYPNFAAPHFFMALAYSRDPGHAKEAHEHLKVAIELDPAIEVKLRRYPELESLR
jgi:tetratricopeptide (TPR) repeat protein/predicted Ser/Thr protein kinase